MKRKITVAICLCLLLVCSVLLTACHTPKNVETVNGRRTVYRYNIELQLRNASGGKIVSTSKVAKYWYTNTKPQTSYVSAFYNSTTLDEAKKFFPDDDLSYTAGTLHSARFSVDVEVVIMLKGNPKAYRPTYSRVGKMVTVSNVTFDCLCANNIASKELWADQHEKKLREFNDKSFLLQNDAVELKLLEEEFEKQYFGACFLTQNRAKFDIDTTGLTVVFSF